MEAIILTNEIRRWRKKSQERNGTVCKADFLMSLCAIAVSHGDKYERA